MGRAAIVGLFCCVALCRAQTSAPGDPPFTFGVTVVDTTGLEGKIYYLKRDSPRLPDFTKMKPKGTIYTSELNVPGQHWRSGFPGVTKRFEWFAIDYHGRMWIDQPGDYRFALLSDDGSKLYIDDQVVIDNDGVHPAERRAGRVELTGGVHHIRVSYFQGPRDAVALVLEVARPGGRYRVFSTKGFRPAKVEDWKSNDAEEPDPPPAKRKK
jgi:hypothetical protein